MARPLALLLCLIAALGLAACGGDDDEGDGGAAADESSESSGGSTAGEADSAPDEPEAAAGGACKDVQAPEPKADGGAKKPGSPLAAGKTYLVTLTTSCGDITIRLNQKTAPKTAASFASLVRSGFYDGTVFHRLIPGFVIQGGDPTGTGTGGPGYSVRDAPPQDATYRRGVVAMAKTPAEPPGTSGSQFYVVTAPDAGLPPEYALLGEVTKGQGVAGAIERLGDPASGEAGTPLRPVVLEKATLRVS